MHVGEAHVQPLKLHRQTRVIKAEQVQNEQDMEEEEEKHEEEECIRSSGDDGGRSTWDCTMGSCSDPGTGTGTYASLTACQTNCVDSTPGCTDNTAFNYNPSATIDDGSCTYPASGCTDPTAFNYNASDLEVGMWILQPNGNAFEIRQITHIDDFILSTTTDDDHVIELLEGDGPDWEFVEAVVADLKRRLDSMGPVNLDAIEEFDELEDRFNFTKNQHDDLVSSKAKLLEIIERINTESERLFAETFAQVSKNFRMMFKRLFGDLAQADLILQDESDPLECGIDVIAKPPGKKLQSITLMSGGERSMTAVALLFSIYMVKPSPFCVLDELDAPLDESNIGRFLKVLDTFIDQSQFIIVTHSKRTMERADVIYGVTMEEFGVSKPVGMRLTSESSSKGTEPKTAAQKAALKLDA